MEHKWYKFWLRSSRGTNEHTFCMQPADSTEEDLKYAVEEWANQFAAMQVSDNFCSFGFEEVERPPLEYIKRRVAITRNNIAIAQQNHENTLIEAKRLYPDVDFEVRNEKQVQEEDAQGAGQGQDQG